MPTKVDARPPILGVLGIETALDQQFEKAIRFLGASVPDRIFAYEDDEENLFFWQVEGTATAITGIVQIDPPDPLPPGIALERERNGCRLSRYDKRDDLNFGSTPVDAQWNKGYMILSAEPGMAGHVFLRVGVHGYKRPGLTYRTRPVVAFVYTPPLGWDRTGEGDEE